MTCGQVVGWSSADSRRYAFLYEDGIVKRTSAPTLGCICRRLKTSTPRGKIVGMCSQEFGVYYASSYSNGVWSNLNECIDPASGWILDRAVAVNDLGWIVGTGRHNGEDTRAFLLVPVPEPTSLVLLYACSLALALLRIR